MKRVIFLTSILAVVALSGCLKKTSSVREIRPDQMYEIAWIEPSIVLADSLVTLISAARIDSFVTDKPVSMSRSLPSVAFEIPPGECMVSVSLFESYGRLVTPLVVKKLPAGHYKLTLNTGRLDKEFVPSGQYTLKAEYCGFSVSSSFFRDGS